jgi:hypothetical protein
MNDRARVRACRRAPARALGRDAVGHAERRVVLRGHEARQPAAEDEAVDERRVGVALGDDPRPRGGEREAERVVALRGAVRQEPRARGAVGLGGERSARSYGVGAGPRSTPWMSCGMSSASARSPSAKRRPGSAPGRPCGRGRGSAPARGSRRRRARPGTARWAARDRRASAPQATRPPRLPGLGSAPAAARRGARPRAGAPRGRTRPGRRRGPRWASPISCDVRWSLTIVYGCRT